MNRRYDWASKMHSAIDYHKDKSFEWGKNDCCIFTARVIDAMCDSSLEEDLAKKYQDEKTALNYIKQSNGIKSAIESHLGKSEVGRPKRGDAVLFINDDREAVGICTGASIVSMGIFGISSVDRSNIICYWNI